jgi:hypothetical protein
MSIVLQSSGGGSITLQEAVTASNLTITVPAVTGTMLTTASTGTVLQVVNATYATQITTASTTFIDTGLTATITPTSATSKILVLVSQNGCYKGAGNTYIQLKLLRNGTNLINLESIGAYSNTAVAVGTNASSTNYLDSPATTSATTYKTQFCSGDNSTTAAVQLTNGFQPTSTITLMEIAA